MPTEPRGYDRRTDSTDCAADDGRRESGPDSEADRSPTGLADLCRRPGEAPLAAAVAGVIVGAIAYQAAVVADDSFATGVAVLAAGALAYRLAKVAWSIENGYVAAELALRDAEPIDRPVDAPPAEEG